jgi:hypothetical protein
MVISKPRVTAARRSAPNDRRAVNAQLRVSNVAGQLSAHRWWRIGVGQSDDHRRGELTRQPIGQSDEAGLDDQVIDDAGELALPLAKHLVVAEAP